MAQRLRLIIYRSPKADYYAMKGIIDGTKTFLTMRGIDVAIDDQGWSDSLNVLERAPHKTDVDNYRDPIYQQAQWFAQRKNEVVWILCVSGQDINAPKSGLNNFVFGGIKHEPQNLFQNIRPAAIVASTFMLKDDDKNMRYMMGGCIGYHEAAHVQYNNHCTKRDCVFYSGVDTGVPGLRELALISLHKGKIASCGRH